MRVSRALAVPWSSLPAVTREAWRRTSSGAWPMATEVATVANRPRSLRPSPMAARCPASIPRVAQSWSKATALSTPAAVTSREPALGGHERGRRREPQVQQDPLQLARAAGGAEDDADPAGLGGLHRGPGRLADLVVAVQQGPVHVDRHHPHPWAAHGGAGFSQTETWLSLSLVNGSRVQPLQRSRSCIPASRAIRSSSAGHTER